MIFFLFKKQTCNYVSILNQYITIYQWEDKKKVKRKTTAT